MSKRLPHTVDTDKLLELALEPTESKEGEVPEILEYVNDVLPFFSTFNIQPGEQYIKKPILYSIYKAWSINPLKRKDFINEANKFLPSGASYNKGANYKINQNAVKLTHEVYLKYKNPYRRTKSKAWSTHFQDFLNYHALTPGQYWLNGEILYFIYDKFVTFQGFSASRILSKSQFEAFCELHFERKFTAKGKIFAISDNIVNFFQPGQLERMKETYGKKEESPKKTVKKRKTKVPRARSKVQPKNKG